MAGDDEENLGPLKAGLSDLLDSGLFSDLQIRCRDGTVYNVHKNILCAQSLFFKNALNPSSNFLEAQSNTVNLEHENPATVKALVEYFYRFDYTSRNISFDQLLIFHAQVYALGEAYCVQGLKDRAKIHFRDTFIDAKCPDDLNFPSAVKKIYSTTLETDTGLRKLAVDLAHGYLNQCSAMDGFLNMIGEEGQFSKDLMLRILSLGAPKPRFSCKHCGVEVCMELPIGKKLIHCPFCGNKSTNLTWLYSPNTKRQAMKEFECPSCREVVSMDLNKGYELPDFLKDTFAPCCGVPQSNDKWSSEIIEVDDEDEDPSNEYSSTLD